MEFDLNDQEQIKGLDKGDMLGAVEKLPAQCEDAVSVGLKAELPKRPGTINSVGILGMGGSAIGGDMVRALLERELGLPIAVARGYHLPAAITRGSLVFAVSYSGDTEETLSCFEQALERGAAVIPVTSGGRLMKRALEANLSAIEIPSGYQPRAALGYLFLPILVALDRLGVIDDKTGEIEEAISVLKSESARLAHTVPVGQNAAKRLALELYGKVPVIYGSEGSSQVAALRWKTQINENAKTAAFANAFPELDHNEIMGWNLPEKAMHFFELVVLRDKAEHPQNKKRIDATLDLIKDNIYGATEIWSEGKSPLANMMSLTYMGDFTSVYLAFLYQVDPTPVDRISTLKQGLTEA